MTLARNFRAYRYTHVIPRTPSFGMYHVRIPTVNGQGAGAGAGAGRTYGAAQRMGAQRAGADIASRVSRAWGAKRERSASRHAMRLQNGKPCM
eukprot:5301564-Pleurochrysis_carterae.AAC.1